MKHKTTIKGHKIAGRMPTFTAENRAKNIMGDKLVTRRVILPQPDNIRFDIKFAMHPKALSLQYGNTVNAVYPPYRPGEIRVMTEPLYRIDDYCGYFDDKNMTAYPLIINNQTHELLKWRWKTNYLSSRFMPTEAGRYLFRITDTGAEWLQDMSRADPFLEGCPVSVAGPDGDIKAAFHWFVELWDSLNAKRGYPYSSNPMVWVIHYEAVK